MKSKTSAPCRAKDPATCRFHGKQHAGAMQFAAEFAANQQVREEALARVNWHDRQAILFNTPHGSHLYGLAHAGSDEDYFIVYPPSSFGARQSVVNNIDATRMSFNYFVEKASIGSHQSLEAMFSKHATVDQFAAFRAGFHAEGPVVVAAYMRTIRNFAFGDNYKRRRHALRLALNLGDLMRHGRFDPTLSEREVKRISAATNQGLVPDLRYLDQLREITPYHLTWDFEHEGETINEHIAALSASRAAKTVVKA